MNKNRVILSTKLNNCIALPVGSIDRDGLYFPLCGTDERVPLRLTGRAIVELELSSNPSGDDEWYDDDESDDWDDDDDWDAFFFGGDDSDGQVDDTEKIQSVGRLRPLRMGAHRRRLWARGGRWARARQVGRFVPFRPMEW